MVSKSYKWKPSQISSPKENKNTNEKKEIYQVNKARTKRYQKSSIPCMQNMLNDESERKVLMMKDYIVSAYPSVASEL